MENLLLCNFKREHFYTKYQTLSAAVVFVRSNYARTDIFWHSESDWFYFLISLTLQLICDYGQVDFEDLLT